jgi:enoyl-[acyl-carrier-protein] reductase (NADH)
MSEIKTGETREIISEFAQHICNLGFSYAVKTMTMDQVEKYKAKMIDDLCAKLDLMENKSIKAARDQIKRQAKTQKQEAENEIL